MVSLLLVAALLVQPDKLLADFEASTYAPWKAEGTAFGFVPAQGTLPNQMAVTGFKGKGLVNSFSGGDGSTGSMTSPEFTIDRRWMTFLIGGGYDPEKLAIQLIVKGRAVKSATGSNKKPGGSEALHQESWDLSAFRGRRATLRIIDQATGGWGHINIDHIVLTDKKPPMILENASRSITLSKRFLTLPIKNGAPAKRVTLEVEGLPPVTNDVELADGPPDWQTAVDVTPWKGRKVTIRVERLSDDSKGLTGISQSDEAPGEEPLYSESLRGQFHFSPRRGWTNDPNGLVFYKGEFHLFFQHNPFGWGWGNMHWGHAVSKDLIHWNELPIALFPDSMGTMFSGGALVDWKNSSGLGNDGQPPLILFYTAAGTPFVQGLASSLDGRTFTKWEGNPIVGKIENADRDPKVIWHEPSKKWVMVLYLEIPGKPTMQFLTSSDLKAWTPVSRVEGFHECPEFFELPVSGQPGVSKWVLTGASSDYQVGSFDGKVFTPETPMLKGHLGRGFYAAQTFSDVPNRRIMIGWFQTETKGMPFNQSMSIPLDLGLVSTKEGPRLTWAPAPELKVLRKDGVELGGFSLGESSPEELKAMKGVLLDVELSFKPTPGALVQLMIRGVKVLYDADRQILEVAGHKAPAPIVDGRQTIRALCDRTGLDVFASGGRTFVPMPTPPAAEERSVTLTSLGEKTPVTSLKVHQLESAWKQP